MLSNVSTGEAYLLTENLLAKGITVAPLVGSPLETLCQESTDGINVVGGENVYADNVVEESRYVDAAGTAIHEAVMQDMVKNVSNVVRKTIYVAKNVVNPALKSVLEKYEARVADSTHASSNVMSVVPDNLSKVWSNPTVLGMIEPYTNVAIKKLTLDLRFPVLEPEELMDLVLTGSDSFDREIKKFIEEVGPEVLMSTYDSVYRLTGSLNESTSLLSGDTQADRARVLLTHVLARKLINSPPESMNIGLGEYREYVAKLQEQSGRAAIRIIERYELAVARKSLVISYPYGTLSLLNADSGVVLVNGQVYKQWLKDGGCPEMLFGAALTDRLTDGGAILADGERYVKAYEREKAMLNTQLRLDSINIQTDAMLGALTEHINEMSEEDTPKTKAECHRALADKRSMITAITLKEPALLARKLLTCVVYDHTDAEALLSAIDNVCEANKDISMEEAATLGTIEYVAHWVSTNIVASYL